MDKLFSNKITFFSFFYSLLIICYHANANVNFENIVKNDSYADKAALVIDTFFTESGGTFFFIILSAFLLYYNLTRKNVKDKLIRRVKTLLVPWLIWNLIGTISSYRSWNKGIIYILSYYLTSRYWEALWFVQMLMLMLLFIPVITWIFKIKHVRELVLVLLFLLSYYNWPFVQEMNVFPSVRFKNEVLRMLAHLPMYCFGAYMGLNWSDSILRESYNSNKKVKIGGALLLILSISLSGTFPGYVLKTLQSVFLWVLFDKNFFRFKIQWWMQISFYTYAIHSFILHWEGKLIKLSGIFAEEFQYSTVSIRFALLWRLSLSGMTFVLVALSAYILIRFAPRVYELLSGGRVPKEDM